MLRQFIVKVSVLGYFPLLLIPKLTLYNLSDTILNCSGFNTISSTTLLFIIKFVSVAFHQNDKK